jgi:O-antigen/teichoic acid export membrane protein
VKSELPGVDVTRAGGGSLPPDRLPPFAGISTGLVSGAGVAFVLQVVGVALAYVLHVLLARWLGVAGYGVYAYVVSWATVLATAGALGLPLASLRFVSQHLAAHRWVELRGVLLGAPGLVAIGGMTVFAVGTVWAAWTASDPLPWILGFACVPLMAQLALGAEIARAMGSIAASLVPGRILRPVLIFLIVVLVWERSPKPALALAATVAALVGAMALQGLWLYRLAPTAVRTARPRYEPRLWLTTAFPMMIATGTALLLTQLDLLMVGLLEDEESVGLYSAAAKTAAMIPLVLYALNVAAAPSFAALHERGDTFQLQVLASRVARWAFWPSLVLAIALSLGSGWILGWFGASFVAARGVVVMLAMAYLFSAGVGSVGYLLNLTGNEHHNARTLIWGAGIDVALNAVLIPVLGIMGAAMATTVTWVFVGLRLHHLARRHVGVRSSVLSALS